MPNKEVPLNTWHHIGHVAVDAGLIMVGDPCYVSGDDPANPLIQDWDAFCDYIRRPENEINSQTACSISFSNGMEGAGVVVSSGFGDGFYPVYVKFSDEGPFGTRIKALKVVFTDEEKETP